MADASNLQQSLEKLLCDPSCRRGSPVSLAKNTLIAAYDETHYPAPPVSPLNLLRFLMEQHRLSASALPEPGSQAVVDAILSGKRELYLRQVKAPATRFKVPATLCI